MKGFFIFTHLLLFGFIAFSQNLAHNPDFELNTACPFDTGQISFASEWFSAGAGADYFDSCCIDCKVDVPLNYMGYQQSYSGGHAYAGIYTYSEDIPNYRGYISGNLDPMIIGHWYRVKIHIANSSRVQYGSAKPGAFFYIAQQLPVTNQLMPFSPQIQNLGQTGNDTLNWGVISNIFYADSAYTKVLIGNFFDDVHSGVEHNVFYPPQTPESRGAYCLVDGILIADITATYLAGLEEEQQTVTVYPNPFTDFTRLSFSNPQAQPHALAVYNMQGTQARHIENITGHELTLQRDGLPAGYYFYRLSNNEGINATGKLLIQ